MPTPKPDTATGSAAGQTVSAGRVGPSEPSTFASRRAAREAAGDASAQPRNRLTLRAGLDAEQTPPVVRRVQA